MAATAIARGWITMPKPEPPKIAKPKQSGQWTRKRLVTYRLRALRGEFTTYGAADAAGGAGD
jgi:hypothetical protein